DGDLTAASKILYGDIPALKQQLRDAEEQESDDASAQRPMVADHVGPDDIAEVVEAWTGIPSGRLLQGETEKLLEMEEIIGRRLIGQQRAVAEVSDAVRRARAGISDPHRPTGSFLFLGPTGVGKTELAKALAEFLFDDERAMIRIDMSEYGEKHTVSRLVGAPPGYVGYDQGGQLTEAVRRRPYSVVLLDEIEKAHQDVFDVLLQVLDDGRLTDGQGRTVDFRSTILILTSNLGAVALQDQTLAEKEKHDRVMQVVRASFKPSSSTVSTTSSCARRSPASSSAASSHSRSRRSPTACASGASAWTWTSPRPAGSPRRASTRCTGRVPSSAWCRRRSATVSPG